jgi:hypothetical protein
MPCQVGEIPGNLLRRGGSSERSPDEFVEAGQREPGIEACRFEIAALRRGDQFPREAFGERSVAFGRLQQDATPDRPVIGDPAGPGKQGGEPGTH